MTKATRDVWLITIISNMNQESIILLAMFELDWLPVISIYWPIYILYQFRHLSISKPYLAITFSVSSQYKWSVYKFVVAVIKTWPLLAIWKFDNVLIWGLCEHWIYIMQIILLQEFSLRLAKLNDRINNYPKYAGKVKKDLIHKNHWQNRHTDFVQTFSQ